MINDVLFVYWKADHTQLDRYGQRLLYGKGYDRWFDKSFTLVVGKNGRVSIYLPVIFIPLNLTVV